MGGGCQISGPPSKALTAGQAEAVLQAAKNSRMHAYIVVSLLTGARAASRYAPSCRPGRSPWTASSRPDWERFGSHSHSVSYAEGRFLDRNRPLICVGVAGFEPAASSSRTKRAAKLRHTPLTAREV